jgi:alpha-mannosidase
MWVEADLNLTGGEALFRQLLYGKRFYQDEFGLDAKIAWLPDDFGFPASLPQILKKRGIEYFLTTKLSWSTSNRFPRHSFWWRGIDGSEVLTHMPPEGTYNSAALPHSIRHIAESYEDKDVS